MRSYGFGGGKNSMWMILRRILVAVERVYLRPLDKLIEICPILYYRWSGLRACQILLAQTQLFYDSQRILMYASCLISSLNFYTSDFQYY